MISKLGRSSLNNHFLRAIEGVEPKKTIAYFWPDPPLRIVERARERGLLTVREMINTFRGTAKAILDKAYNELGLQPAHGITDESVEIERQELALYDYVFASNSLVEASLVEAGIKAERIIPTTFGWSPERFPLSPLSKKRSRFKVLFVGTVSVRKGIPALLAAWERSGVDGELIMAGKIEKALQPLLVKTRSNNQVSFLDYVSNVGDLYRSADVFVFPTLEEGGPQVTYEAAGCGLPVITTPMGAGRIIKHDVNGLIIEPNDYDSLAQALSQLASSAHLRERLARQAFVDAQQYTYEKIGNERSAILKRLINA